MDDIEDSVKGQKQRIRHQDAKGLGVNLDPAQTFM